MANPASSISNFQPVPGEPGVNYLFEQWNGPAATFTQYATDGVTVITTRPLTGAETNNLLALDAGNTVAVNAATIQANIQAHMATISAWIAANPTGATLTAAQTLVLAKMLYGVGLLLNQEFASTTGT